MLFLNILLCHGSNFCQFVFQDFTMSWFNNLPVQDSIFHHVMVQYFISIVNPTHVYSSSGALIVEAMFFDLLVACFDEILIFFSLFTIEKFKLS